MAVGQVRRGVQELARSDSGGTGRKGAACVSGHCWYALGFTHKSSNLKQINNIVKFYIIDF